MRCDAIGPKKKVRGATQTSRCHSQLALKAPSPGHSITNIISIAIFPSVYKRTNISKSDSEISNDSDYDPTHESLAERISALRDIVPPTTRSWFWNKWLTTQRVVKGVVFFAGRSMWSISVSALLIGVPFALCWAEEQQVIAMEQEVRMREMGADVLTAGGGDPMTADAINQALGKEGGVQTKAAGL